MWLVSVIFLLTCGWRVDAYKILILYPTPSYSHQQPIMALTEALIKRGHELFVVSPNVVPGLEKNYTYVDVSFTYKFFHPEEETEGALDLQKQITKWDMMQQLLPLFAQLPVHQFKSEQYLQFERRVKEENIEFDIVLTESFFIPFTCAISRHLGSRAPLIAMATLSGDWLTEEQLGSRMHLSFVPSLMDPYTDRMSIWQKIDNWYSTTVLFNFFMNIVDDLARDFFKQNYGPEHESLVDGCWSNVSLSLLSSNSLYFYPRQLTPNIIELGPLHIKPPQKLPQNLQAWLDGAEKGVIYFSLGSNMKSKSLPVDVRNNFLRFFKQLPAGYRVLWKWELDGKIPGQSDNILAQKWLPQQSVLAHPKVRMFMTQGGLQSFQEAVHYGVPTVGIPWFADQEMDVAKMVDAGIGIRLRPQDLGSYDKIKTALEAVLFDSSYALKMKKLSAISRDFTQHAVDKGVFWVEHVAKHGGASHLRPITADTTFFQFFCLDIAATILVIVLTVLFILIKIWRFLKSVLGLSGSKIKKA